MCILYFFKFYEILFENHILYEKVISIKIIINPKMFKEELGICAALCSCFGFLANIFNCGIIIFLWYVLKGFFKGIKYFNFFVCLKSVI